MDYAILIPDDCINFYLDGFRRATYPDFFRRYCQATRDVFAEIARRDPQVCARELTDWLDDHPGRFFRGRRLADRQMLMLQYTVPAALEMGQEAFARELSRVWGERHPGCAFRVGTYEELYKGFNNTVLGFKLPGTDA